MKHNSRSTIEDRRSEGHFQPKIKIRLNEFMLEIGCCLIALHIILAGPGACNSQHVAHQSQQPLAYNLSPNRQTSGNVPHHTSPPGSQGNFNVSSRPLDRPDISTARNATSDQFSSPSDWLAWGLDDLVSAESKSDFSARSSSKVATNRKGERRRSQKGNSSKTIFDDEQSDSSDSNEIFDDVEEASTVSGTQKEPECASQGRYYCTYKEDYPLKLVTEVTKYYKWPLEKLFRDLHAQIMPKLAQDSTGNLVCDSITRVVRPGWARNTNERWLVVINTENYHQYVTEVVCQYGTNSRCNFIPPCYYSSCQQRYNTQKLLVIDPSNPYRGPFLSEFLFPSCCVCYVPTASDTFQDKYRPSPATIYQRTMQQESSNNMYPPQFRPAGLLEDLPGALNEQQQAASLVRSSAGVAAPINKQPPNTSGATGQVPSPGEIRRGGEQYKRVNDGGGKHDGLGGSDLGSDFPRLGLSDSLISQRSSSASITDVRQ